MLSTTGVEHCLGVGEKSSALRQTPNTVCVFHGTQYGGAKPVGREGNIPDPHIRSLTLCLVVKEVMLLKQPGGRLRSSHP